MSEQPLNIQEVVDKDFSNSLCDFVLFPLIEPIRPALLTFAQKANLRLG